MVRIMKFLQGIGLIPVSSTSIDTKGEMEVLDTGGKLNYHNGTTASPMVTEAHTATLTNKTIDADGTGNSITNIENADIKTGAAIDAAKIHDGSVSNTEYGYLNGVTSAIQTQLDNIVAGTTPLTLTDAHIFVGNASNDATDVAVTGDISITNTGVVAISAGVIVDADINASAAIARSKIAVGTADHVVINSGTGALSSEAQLATTRGGTGISSTATFPASGVIVTETATETLTNKTLTSPVLTTPTIDIVTWDDQAGTPSNPAAGFYKTYFKTDGRFYSLTPGGVESEIGGAFDTESPAGNVTTITRGTTYLMDSSAVRTIQLPSPTDGFYFYVEDKTGLMATNNTTILRAASELIKGVAANYILEANYGYWLVYSDGTNWYVD